MSMSRVPCSTFARCFASCFVMEDVRPSISEHGRHSTINCQENQFQRSMRHPVYTGGLLTTLEFLRRGDSPQNSLLMGLRILWFIPIKSLVEEDFLRADPQYAAYMQRVRARWIPYVIGEQKCSSVRPGVGARRP